MLKHSFCHLPRVGVATEEKYWNLGLKGWDDVHNADGQRALGKKAVWVRERLQESADRLAARDGLFFQRGLPSSRHWRLFGEFGSGAAYLDIETTGLGFDEDHITTIAVYGGGEVKTYVHGRNLDDFQDDILQFELLVTFNGKCFDVPFIEKHFGMKLDMAHIDLRYVLKQVGLKGGLKSIEKQMGIGRDGLDGVDGYFAVLLWNEFQRTGNEAALQTLLAYNAEDVLHLEELMVYAYNTLLAETPFHPELTTQAPVPPPCPHDPDLRLVDEMRRRYGMF